MTEDDKKSLADKLRAQQAQNQATEPEKPSLGDRLRSAAQPVPETHESEHEAVPSLADRLKAKAAPQEEAAEPSLADRLRDKAKAEAETEVSDQPESSLKGRLQAKAQQSAEPSLADRLKAKSEAGAESQAQPLADRLRVRAEGATPLDEAAAAALGVLITRLKDDHVKMLRRVSLSDLSRDIGSLQQRIQQLPGQIQDVRNRGYVYRTYLEQKVSVFGQQWDQIQTDIKHWIEQESAALQSELKEIEPALTSLNAPALTSAHNVSAKNAEDAMRILDEKIKIAEEKIGNHYNELRREVDLTFRQLQEIREFVEAKEEASFSFIAGENVFLVAKAEWDNGGDKPNGVLFLTNQRFIFEQKEKTGKRFGLFGGKDTQGILWEAPLSSLQEVKTENKGFLGGKDMIELSFGSGASLPRVTVELKGGVSNKFWATEIKRLQRGDAGKDSVIEPDSEMLERMRKAPTDCPNCGGVLPQLMEGMTSLNCKYCGSSVRI